MAAIGLALGASLFYGFSDFLGGLKSRKYPLLSVLLISEGTALVALAAILLASGDPLPEGRFLLYATLAGLAEAVGVAAFYRGLSVGVMSIVSPIAATAPVIPVVAALALGELPGPLQAAGIALAVGGIAMISLERGDGEGRDLGPSVLFGLLTALGFGGFLVAMDAASEASIPWALAIARLAAVAAFAIAFLITRPPLAPRRELPVLTLIGLLIVGADAMYAVASTKDLLSVVAVLSSLYPVVTIALARFYLGERLSGPQKLGAAASLSGAVLISAG
jgi:drug/metabolite transporter (DMT)-like permease